MYPHERLSAENAKDGAWERVEKDTLLRPQDDVQVRVMTVSSRVLSGAS